MKEDENMKISLTDRRIKYEDPAELHKSLEGDIDNKDNIRNLEILFNKRNTLSAFNNRKSDTVELNSKTFTSYDVESNKLASTIESCKFQYIKEENTSKKENPFYKTVKFRDLTKSVISYFIGSLFTFFPGMRNIMGTASHMTAISVLFMTPSQSVGGFLQSLVFGIFFTIYGLIIGLLSLLSIKWFHKHELFNTGKVFVIFVFIGCSTFFLSLIKAKSSKPSINRCIPQAFIMKFLVILNYVPFVDDSFSIQKVLDLGKALSIGIIINLFVSMLVFPRYEYKSLNKDIQTSLSSISKILDLLTKTFLLESEQLNIKLNRSKIKKLMDEHRRLFITLEKRHRLSKMEFLGKLKSWSIIGKVVDRVNRLSQKLSSLSSGVDAQLDMLNELDLNFNTAFKSFNYHTDHTNSYRKSYFSHKSINISGSSASTSSSSYYDFQVLLDFIKIISPSMKRLSMNCKDTLEELNKIFYEKHNKIDFNKLRTNLSSTYRQFKIEQTEAFDKLYIKTKYDGKPNEEIFLVYFFVFSFQEFSVELSLLLNSVEILQESERNDIFGISKFPWISDFISEGFGLLRTDIFNLHRSKGLKRPETQNSAQNDYKPTNLTGKFRLNIWKFFVKFNNFEYQFALKSTISVMILGFPAFIDNLKFIFKEWKFAWTLISLMVVMSPTIGASNMLALYRTGGTCFGAIFGYFIYKIFPKSAIVLTMVSSLFSIPCLYYYLYGKHPRIGQFTLITYNLIVLTKFSYHKKNFYNLFHFAFTRAASVSLGVALGVFITTWIAPYEARTQLRKGLSLYLLSISEFYRKIISLYNQTDSEDTSILQSSSGMILKKHDDSTHLLVNENEDPVYKKKFKEFLNEELELQIALLRLIELLPQAKKEPRLKGPFPHHIYSKILQSCQVILDKFVSIRIIVTKDHWNDEIVKNYVKPLQKYRPALAGNIILYFYVLASSLELKSALPPYMPPASASRKRMIQALRELNVVKNRLLMNISHDTHVYYYAFIVLLDDIISELEKLSKDFRLLFGGSDEIFIY